jgi:hypothetical protein
MVKPNVTADTKIADAIAADPSLVERLAALHPTFKRLKNPLIRRTMGRLTTLGDAARVAGVPLGELLAVAGAHRPEAGDRPPPAAETARPAWLDGLDLEGAERLDVRPLLATGEEPLGPILKRAAGIAPGGVLVIEAPFDPAPLRRVLGNKGFSAHAERLAEDHWRVVFRRDREAVPAAEPGAHGARLWHEGEVSHIDVRGLEPPAPMLAILELLERADCGAEVIVHHEREPLYLYPELAERGWRSERIDGEVDEVRLRLSRAAP